LEERETWAAELRGIGRDAGSLKETLAVTFIKRSYTGFRRLSFGFVSWKTGVKFSSIQNVT
jgi:hypothetical protein